jgi:hypothetical protein
MLGCRIVGNRIVEFTTDRRTRFAQATHRVKSSHNLQKQVSEGNWPPPGE